MHVLVSANELNRGLSMVTRALMSKAPMPSYEGVLIETTDEGLILTITNGSMTVRSLVSATVEKDGSALLPARLLYELTRKLEGDIKISIADRKAKIEAANISSTELMCMDAVEFPEISDVVNGTSVKMPHGAYSSAVSKTVFALSSEASQRILTGLYMQVFRDEVRIVCLDGFRLAMQKIFVVNEVPEDMEYISCIIPGAIAKEIALMASEGDENIEFNFTNSHIMAVFGNTKVYSPLIMGEYINYQQILPESWTSAVKLDRHIFISSVERAAIIAREGNNLLRLSIKDEQLSISANTEKANSFERIAIDLQGQPLDIAFNSRYLMDVVKNIDGKELVLRFNTNVSPCVVCPVKGDQYTYLVLPVRTIEYMEE